MKAFAIAILFLVPLLTFAQEVHFHWFMRTPQVINRNMTNQQLSYSSLVSTGVGTSSNGVFTELGTYVSDGNYYGYYSFSGTTIFTVLSGVTS